MRWPAVGAGPDRAVGPPAWFHGALNWDFGSGFGPVTSHLSRVGWKVDVTSLVLT